MSPNLSFFPVPSMTVQALRFSSCCEPSPTNLRRGQSLASKSHWDPQLPKHRSLVLWSGSVRFPGTRPDEMCISQLGQVPEKDRVLQGREARGSGG